MAVMAPDRTDDFLDSCGNIIGPASGMDKQRLDQDRPLDVGQVSKIGIRRLQRIMNPMTCARCQSGRAASPARIAFGYPEGAGTRRRRCEVRLP